jgi:hypothetical protein
MAFKAKKIDRSKLKELLLEVYHGEFKEDAYGLKIRCPWHSPDNNPSCVVFHGSGIFHCLVCHGDKQKGHRGVNAYRGFLALGMPESRARQLFILGDPNALADTRLKTSRLPSLDEPMSDTLSLVKKEVLEDKVVQRASWPKNWGFRDIDYATMTETWFVDRFEPTKVILKRERLPRIALSVGGAYRFKATWKPRHEVYLRLSSAVKPKAANSIGLTLDSDLAHHASLFGLINNKISPNSRGIILVEGPYDAIHTLQHIHSPEVGGGFDVIALLGTPQWASVCKQLLDIVLPQAPNIPIILAFDHDKAGQKLTKSALDVLQSGFISRERLKVLDYPSTIKDPGDLPFAPFLTSFSEFL